MRELQMISFILFYFLLSCNGIIKNSKITDCDDYLKGKNTNSKIVDLYEIDTVFHKYLDTIIDNESKYHYYNECSSGFLYSTSLVQSSENSDFNELLIGSINKYMYDYSRCFGIFEYKGKTFLCDSLCDRSLLHYTGKKTSAKYLMLEKYLCQDDIDDRYSLWYFVYKSNKIMLTGHYYPY